MVQVTIVYTLLILIEIIILYFGGGTTSPDLNTTPSAFQQSYNSSNALSPDGFITTIDNNADSTLFSTYFGTDSYDQVFFIDVTKNDQVHVLGQTNDTNNFFIKTQQYLRKSQDNLFLLSQIVCPHS